MITIPKDSSTVDTGRFWLELAVTGTSDSIYIPPGMMSISVALHPAVGQTARIEYTLSSSARINAGTARWIAWPLGDISASNADSLLTTAAAIRVVSSSGTATLELVAR